TTIVLGHARGVVLLCGAKAGLEISEYTPAEIKKAVCGRGSATKEQVQYMVGSLLRLKSPPRPADAADGVAAALAHALSSVTGRKIAAAAVIQREADTLGGLAATLAR
ncbi:MAG: crossover junction endodeoxyribonuclease RuvC, partial [Gemmatimonadaceae bacterium]